MRIRTIKRENKNSYYENGFTNYGGNMKKCWRYLSDAAQEEN